MGELKDYQVIHQVTVGMYCTGQSPTVTVKQYDNSVRVLQVNLVSNNLPYKIPSGFTVRLRGTRADGKGIMSDALITEGNTAWFEITKAMTACAGKIPCDVELSNADGAVVKTASLVLNVQWSPLQDGTVEASETFSALEAALAKVQSIPEVDDTLTKSGQAADAEVTGDAINKLSEETVTLPKDTAGNVIPGTVGWYAVSDGAGGIKWVESAPSTGGGDTGTTTHGVIWDLVNVSSSNNAVSVSDGISFSAVLTPADGYTLGTPTITMGGVDITDTAWNADSATITIASVTGDVAISCAGVEMSGTADTTAVIETYDYGQSSDGSLVAFAGLCVTKHYEFQQDTETFKALSTYDADNDYVDQSTCWPNIKYYTPSIKHVEEGYVLTYLSNANKNICFRDGVLAYYSTNSSISGNAEKSMPYGAKQNSNALYLTSVNFVLCKADIDDSYAYWGSDGFLPVGVRAGDVIFAGKNTPYYGMSNIDGTMVSSGAATESVSTLSVDADYAQDYGVSTLSLITDESAGTAAETGLNAEFAAAIEQAKNAWMLEANGNTDKIPLIIHTDQHGNYSKPLWDTISRLVDWYEISKVINLGDTVSAWVDADTSNPLTKCDQLEDYLASMESVPYSKRIEIFGNHDTWQIVDDSCVGLTPQNYLRKYFKNIYARGVDNYGNMVVYDSRYNVKYLIISGMAYDSDIGGYSHFIIPSASWDWIIAQLSKPDGYDVVVLSHVALGAGGATVTDPTGESDVSSCGTIDWVSRADLWAARKNKTSGSFTDQYGVSHTYDFSGCDGDLLCGLHGHEHADGYCYIGNSLLDVFFDAYYISPNAIHFILIDRENRQLNVWKVDNTPQVQNYQVPIVR